MSFRWSDCFPKEYFSHLFHNWRQWQYYNDIFTETLLKQNQVFRNMTEKMSLTMKKELDKEISRKLKLIRVYQKNAHFGSLKCPFVVCNRQKWKQHVATHRDILSNCKLFMLSNHFLSSFCFIIITLVMFNTYFSVPIKKI